jgi:transposase-like protein
MLGHVGEYGLVRRLSREIGVSRQTLYTWRGIGADALRQAFTPAASVPVITLVLERQILTVLVAGHASDRGIQACLEALGQPGVSLGTITVVLREAQRRARQWVVSHVPPTSRALALDEIFGNDHQRAYLSVVDSHGGAVWAMEGLLAVDAESWTLVLWDLQERELRWDASPPMAAEPCTKPVRP